MHTGKILLLGIWLFIMPAISHAQNAEQLNMLANIQYEHGNFNAAISLLKLSIKLEPTADRYFGLGLSYAKTGDLDNAYFALEQAATRNRKYTSGLVQLATIHSHPEMGRFDPDKALSILKRAKEIDPNNIDAHYKLGEIHFLKGTMGINTTVEKMRDHQKLAEIEFLQALRLKPDIAEAHHYLGQLYGTWGQHNSAVLEFQKTVSLEPANYSAWLNLGKGYARIGMNKEARTALQNAQKSQDKAIHSSASRLLSKLNTEKQQTD